jgi:ribosomal protein S18 acetylase RimI-like enzyme
MRLPRPHDAAKLLGMEAARHAIAADLPQLTATLTFAFLDDPLVSWIFPDSEARPHQLNSWMRLTSEMGLTRGHFYTAGANAAAAVWSPPDVKLFDAIWGARLAQLLTEELGERGGEVLQSLAHAFESQPEESHFYLFTLGTHPDHQGRGLGGLVVERVLEICDTQGLPAYLESSNERNHSFYHRHGFETVSEIRVADDGPRLWPMRREPHPR